MRNRFVSTTLLLLTLVTQRLIAADDEPIGGLVHGRVIFNGDIPEPEKLDIDKDKQHTNEPLYDRSLIIDPDSRGVRNVVVWLGKLTDKSKAASRDKEGQEVIVSIKNGQYDPHVAIASVGDRIKFVNEDNFGHNTKVDFFRHPAFGATVAPADDQVYPLSVGERWPVRFLCTVHPWMNGWLVVGEHHLVAITNLQGEFKIENVPPGIHEATLWHERTGKIITLRFRMADNAADRNLGTVKMKLD